jgi:uncharacterized membrane protein YciS (DUF1049 family)
MNKSSTNGFIICASILAYAFLLSVGFKLALIGQQLDRIEKALSEQAIVRAKP